MKQTKHLSPSRNGWLLGALSSLIAVSLSCTSSPPREPGAGPATNTGDGKVVLGPYVEAVGPDRFTVCWETKAKAATRLPWGTTPECLGLFEDATPTKRHEVPVTGLRLGTTAWYRLASAGAPGEAVAVRTRQDSNEPLRIAVLGDTHSSDGSHAQLIADILAEKPHFLLHTGDLSLRATEGEDDFFRVEGPLLRSVPLLPARGNHDDDAPRFVQLFVRLQGGTEPYYVTRWGPVAVVVIDTNQSTKRGGAQERWLARMLEDLARESDVVFRFVVMHWGPFDSGSGHGSNMKVRSALVPLFEHSGVDIVFSGHDHVFERSTVHAVRYVVTGGGGGGGGKHGRKRHAVLGSSWTEASASTSHHCLLEIAGRTLRFTAREAGTGRLLDEFRLDKGPLAASALPSTAAKEVTR